MKKMTIGFAAIFSLLSSTSFGATPAPAGQTKSEISIPCFNGGFTFGLAGYYLRPSTTQLNFTEEFPEFVSSVDTGPGHFKNVRPQYHWGYGADAGYYFSRTGNDILLTFKQLKAEDTRSFRNNVKMRDLITGDLENGNFGRISGESEFKVVNVDLDLGQHLNVGCDLKMRLFGGLRYSYLSTDVDTSFIEDPSESLTGILEDKSAKHSSRFNGLGPRFGVEGNYYFGCGFGVVGQFATALLIGNLRSSFSSADTTTIESLVINNDVALDAHDPRIIPNFDGKLGLDYSYVFCNYSRTRLTIEAGYYVNYYFNANDHITNSTGLSPEETPRQSLAVSFEGPYVGIHVDV